MRPELTKLLLECYNSLTTSKRWRRFVAVYFVLYYCINVYMFCFLLIFNGDAYTEQGSIFIRLIVIVIWFFLYFEILFRDDTSLGYYMIYDVVCELTVRHTRLIRAYNLSNAVSFLDKYRKCNWKTNILRGLPMIFIFNEIFKYWLVAVENIDSLNEKLMVFFDICSLE